MVRNMDMLCKETGHSAVQEAKIRTVFNFFCEAGAAPSTGSA